MPAPDQKNPVYHTQKIKSQLQDLVQLLRADSGKITEPKAQALFETAAQVLTGLGKAFEDYERKSEVAWKL